MSQDKNAPMEAHMFGRFQAIGLSLLFAFGALGCQDYGFEELPNSVVKEKRWTKTISIASEVDILFIIDNSGSMVGEQAQLGDSFKTFTAELEKYFGDKYHIAIATAGIQSSACPPCDQIIQQSCMNETGEGGRFQDRIGKNIGTIDVPEYTFRTDPECDRIVTILNKECFYDDTADEGFALVGVNGCGYERGLSAMKLALGDLTEGYNAGFLRDAATLAVVVISDEEDCGEVGDITEGTSIGGNACYFAAKGVDPEDNANDSAGLPYRLTPVEEYYNFLLGLKGGQEGMVKFAAIVGVKDVNSLSSTTIEYQLEGSRWGVVPACTTAGCTGKYCSADPGTRYIKLAQMFGIDDNGLVDTICQSDFSDTMKKIGSFVACPKRFLLQEELLDPDLANILINGEPVPQYSRSFTDKVEKCSELDSLTCEEGRCIQTWKYCSPGTPAGAASDCEAVCPPPSSEAPGGQIVFAPHYDPCELFEEGDQVHIELIYVTP